MASWPENWRLFDRGRRSWNLILSALLGKEWCSCWENWLWKKAWDASEQQVQWANTSNVLHLINLKLPAAFGRAVTENNGQAGWEFSGCSFCPLGIHCHRYLGGRSLLWVTEIEMNFSIYCRLSVLVSSICFQGVTKINDFLCNCFCTQKYPWSSGV